MKGQQSCLLAASATYKVFIHNLKLA